MTDARITALPTRSREHLERLQSALVDGLGAELHSIMVFGSLARGGFDAERSDIDVVIILRSDSIKALRAIGPALDLARSAARIESVLLRADELGDAADVFPLFYDDIRGCHILLHGSDPFASVQIHDEHRRLRIEQELREARIRLRRVIAESASNPRVLAGAIERKVKQIRGPLHALLGLRGVAESDDTAAVLRGCAKRYDLDLAALGRARETTDDACDALVKLLDAAIGDVDDTTTTKDDA